MISTVDKAWVAFITPMLLYMAEAVLSETVNAVDVMTNPNTWIMGISTAVMVWAIPNKPKGL